MQHGGIVSIVIGTVKYPNHERHNEDLNNLAGIDTRIDLVYYPADPLVTSFVFHRGDGTTTTWVISRDLLLEALHDEGMSGIGQVRILWESDYVHIYLNGLDETFNPLVAAVAIETEDLFAFLLETCEMYPLGSEPSWEHMADELIYDAIKTW